MPRLLITAIATLGLAPAAFAADICALPKSDAKVASLSWLAGDWIETGKTRVVREHWSGPYGGLLLGVGMTIVGDAAKSFEFFRIAQTPSGISYFASPNAKPAVEFKAIELCADKVVFENKTNDFPHRVIYRKEADGTLHARIEGTIKGKLEGEDWTYKPER
ncbi:MAG: hypothetical protein JNK07_10070 [Alphaproteobacteria bacterium]|nr:hypothetical protein [Alphaproteobacteria bacterium]